MNETVKTDIGGWPGGGQLHNAVSRVCFTTMTTFHETGKLTNGPFVMIAQSSADLFPHILAGCDPCRGCPARAWKQQNLLHILLLRSDHEAFSFITRVKMKRQQ